MRTLTFLSRYPLAVADGEGCAELWVGIRRKHRVARALSANRPSVAAGELLLILEDGRTLRLVPVACVAAPVPNAEPEVFLLEGRGRRGVLLVAMPGGFEQTSEEALEWLNRACALTHDADSPTTKLDAPYLGLSPFTAADADVFFGRERETEAFLNRLRAEPLLVVVGPSGAGKTSFVHAGVLPALSESFRAVVLRPGATPLSTVLSKLAEAGVRTEGLSRESDGALVASRVHAAAIERDVTLVLVVDQFEELFTLTHDQNERTTLCQWLTYMARTPLDPVRVVLTIRDDFQPKRNRRPHSRSGSHTPSNCSRRRAPRSFDASSSNPHVARDLHSRATDSRTR